MEEISSLTSVQRIARLPGVIRNVHLMGIGGTAMTALAGMLVERGFRVTGSDGPIYEPTASVLKRLQIEVRSPFDPRNLAPTPDLVIVGNVVTRNNPEVQALLATSIPYLSMPEALAHFVLTGRRVLMVAGTHGKTTSTAMLAHVLASAGRDPSMMVGGVAKNFSSNYRLGTGPEFVIEGDEYDTAFFDKGPKFLHYGANGAIITAVEFDHADIYRDLEHVKKSFRALADQMNPGSVLAVCADSQDAVDVARAARARVLTYGLAGGEFRADRIRIDQSGARFEILRHGRPVSGEILLPVGGRMNVANALGVYVLAREVGLGSSDVERGLGSFAGVMRRQEIVGEATGVTVIDDFAHHPTAIRATLEAIAERYAGRRILAAFEPRSNTARRNVFQADFATAFDHAARVYLAPAYFKENDPIPRDQRLSTEQLATAISSRSIAAFAARSSGEILEKILADRQPGDVVLFMSNGAFDRLPVRLWNALQARGERAADGGGQ